jgi:hypothetical protein
LLPVIKRVAFDLAPFSECRACQIFMLSRSFDWLVALPFFSRFVRAI